MKKLNMLLDKLIKPISYRFGILETTLKLNWSKLLHEPLSLYSKPYKISFDKYSKHNTLYITAENGNTAIEIQYLIPVLIEKIAILFGYKAIHKIKIRQY
ncbi:MAG: DUF721 domain-containing protein [Rickettsiaceae bacterium H1]|nr:DUF721 domain-containing protein [Rickettsiaceae bacterium H1]